MKPIIKNSILLLVFCLFLIGLYASCNSNYRIGHSTPELILNIIIQSNAILYWPLLNEFFGKASKLKISFLLILNLTTFTIYNSLIFHYLTNINIATLIFVSQIILAIIFYQRNKCSKKIIILIFFSVIISVIYFKGERYYYKNRCVETQDKNVIHTCLIYFSSSFINRQDYILLDNKEIFFYSYKFNNPDAYEFLSKNKYAFEQAQVEIKTKLMPNEKHNGFLRGESLIEQYK